MKPSFFKSTTYAFNGVIKLLKNERNFNIQVVVTFILTIVGFYFNINTTEWVLQLLCCGLILALEALNTAIEKVCDFINPEHDKRIGDIKDISAGAVFIVSIFSLIIGLIIYHKYFIELFN